MNQKVKRPVPHHPEEKAKHQDACTCRPGCACSKVKEKKKQSTLFHKIGLVCLILLPGAQAFAQEADTQQTFWKDPINHPMLKTYLLLGLVGITIILVVVVLFFVVKTLNLLQHQIESEQARKRGIPLVPSLTLLERWWNRINNMVPITEEEKIDLGHNFDGIRELDNHLPPWWKGLFYGAIIWGIIYMVVYHVAGSLPLSEGEYQQELAKAQEEASALRASRPVEAIDIEKLEFSRDAEIIGKGKMIFTSNNCGQCHRNDGGGNTIGPNLTDEFWLHGGSVKDIFVTVDKGVVEKGMPAWGKVMRQEDVRNVVFYVMSLQGSNPPNGKAPQGNKFVPEKKEVATDTTKLQAAHK